MVNPVLSKEDLRENGLSGKTIEVAFFYIARDDNFNLHPHVKKKYKLVFDKRILKVEDGFKTFPYGYKKSA